MQVREVQSHALSHGALFTLRTHVGVLGEGVQHTGRDWPRTGVQRASFGAPLQGPLSPSGHAVALLVPSTRR